MWGEDGRIAVSGTPYGLRSATATLAQSEGTRIRANATHPTPAPSAAPNGRPRRAGRGGGNGFVAFTPSAAPAGRPRRAGRGGRNGFIAFTPSAAPAGRPRRARTRGREWLHRVHTIGGPCRLASEGGARGREWLYRVHSTVIDFRTRTPPRGAPRRASRCAERRALVGSLARTVGGGYGLGRRSRRGRSWPHRGHVEQVWPLPRADRWMGGTASGGDAVGGGAGRIAVTSNRYGRSLARTVGGGYGISTFIHACLDDLFLRILRPSPPPISACTAAALSQSTSGPSARRDRDVVDVGSLARTVGGGYGLGRRRCRGRGWPHRGHVEQPSTPPGSRGGDGFIAVGAVLVAGLRGEDGGIAVGPSLPTT
eukprot:tig00020563_g11259.t2